MEKRIIYTESGKNALDKYLDEKKIILEKYISDEKYVFGDESIEITASDIKMFMDGDKINKRKIEKRKFLVFLINTYIILGAILAIGGLLYPFILDMFMHRPNQFMFTIMGVAFFVCGIIYKIYLHYRK